MSARHAEPQEFDWPMDFLVRRLALRHVCRDPIRRLPWGRLHAAAADAAAQYGS